MKRATSRRRTIRASSVVARSASSFALVSTETTVACASPACALAESEEARDAAATRKRLRNEGRIGRRDPFLDKSGKIKTKDGKPGVSLDWFNMLYQVLLGQEKGPRFGSFVAVYGIQNTIDMIDGALARSA
jgi:lysyl-tRNA synthetase class I